MVRILQDLKFKKGGQIGESLTESPIPDGATIATVVRDRMVDRLEDNIVQGACPR